ncbi:MAG: cyclic nucleotide-binding domain-containing protein, partial [Spirochaetota bacterium]|nr:cyclic nucleotide-binding domain-containing protein [Spirochaetota bacterium]
GSGFTASKPCSGIVISYNSDFMLVDCIPYIENSLNARGISKQQVKSIFITHIHDDHCNIFPLVLFDNKIKFLGTKEIFWMACKKLSLMTQHPIDTFTSYFDFVELKPYEENEFYGLNIVPHYTVHSIPTIGASFSMNYDGKKHSITFVGDNKALPDIKKMVDDGHVSADKYQYIHKLYKNQYNLLFSDGGMGILHGDPKDSLSSKSDRVIFLHLEKLPKEYDTTFTLASHGKRFILSQAGDRAPLIKTLLILNHHYPGITEEWQTTLLSNINITNYNTGDIIMKQGEESNKMIYIILSGSVNVLYHDGFELKELAIKEAGDIIGDMAAINRVTKRSASVLAKIPVTLCEIDENLFYSFVCSEKRIDSIKMKWNIRSELEKQFPFSKLSDIINDKIVSHVTRLKVNKEQTIIEQGTSGNDFYIILNGQFAIIRDGEIINYLYEGNMFGEYGSLGDQTRNATVKSLEDGVILKMKRNDIINIINSTPALGFYINQIMKDRKI